MLTPAPVQTTYTRFMNVGMVGMPATTYGWDIVTRLAEDPTLTAGIAFGIVVSQGTLHGPRSAVKGIASGGLPIGITAADHTLPTFTGGAPVDTYNDGDNMAVMTRGDIWVSAVGTVVAGTQVYYNSATGAVGPSSITNATALVGAVWLTPEPLAASNIMATATGTLAVVRLLAIAAL